MSDVSIFIVTYRRHDMLKRALLSVKNQTFSNFRAFIVNDDPDDTDVGLIVNEICDDRFQLFKPIQKRGATRNFNLMFSPSEATFVALLEDDNWWQPSFLEEMLALMRSNPDCEAACSNERIWKETQDNKWSDTGVNIWPNFGIQPHTFRIEDLCGSAKLCNSSAIYRLNSCRDLSTPDDIPVDVTEHFRERLFTGRFLLNSRVLVNYAETLKTARGGGSIWGDYQSLLIGSVFAAIHSREARTALSRRLWAGVPSATSPRAVTLLLTGLVISEARSLAFTAPMLTWLRGAINFIRRPRAFFTHLSVRSRRSTHFTFLCNAPVTKRVASEFEGTI